jgi:SAM-dependent methyltransferase
MQEIRERIRQRPGPPRLPAEAEIPLETAVRSRQLPDMHPLETTLRSLHLNQSMVGELPPQPSSLRGSLGSLLVKTVRRMLFWYTPQIRDFQATVVEGFERQLAALRSVMAAAQQDGCLLVEAANRLEKVEQALEAETAAREQLSSHLAEERGAREALSFLLADKSRQRDIAIQQLRAENSHQHARISILLEDVRKKTAVITDAQPPVELPDEDRHTLDGLYLALEDRFRGSRAEIGERLRFYLPMLETRHIGTERMPILDLGCGRGEWLEILADANLDAYGIDTNRIFVAQCRDRGLRVTEEDALQHLRSLPDRRLGAVTGFHIIEHLPFDVLIKLIDETVRVLKPGGLAIFETPNPQNVLVGTNNFYIDPTHRNPIPSLTAQFLMEARGLCDVEILQLHPYAESYKVADGGTELARRFNEYFYGPQDYAVVGRRV